MWDIFRLRSNFSGAAIQECGVFLGIGGWAGEGRGRGTRSIGTNKILSPLPHPTPNTQKTLHILA